MKNLIPDYYARNIYTLTPDFYKSIRVKYVFSDLDNTLDAYDSLTPSDIAIKYANALRENGIQLFIISNNRYKRVSTYANALGVEFLSQSGKPSGKKIKKFIESKVDDIESALIIGDQLLTDVMASKKAGIKVCLTDKLVKRDQIITFFNRRIDNILRKRMIKKGLIDRIGG